MHARKARHARRNRAYHRHVTATLLRRELPAVDTTSPVSDHRTPQGAKRLAQACGTELSLAVSGGENGKRTKRRHVHYSPVTATVSRFEVSARDVAENSERVQGVVASGSFLVRR